jgi:hypothetical protein
VYCSFVFACSVYYRCHYPIVAVYDLARIIFVESRLKRWAGHVAYEAEWRGAYRVLVGKRGGKKPLGRLRIKWEDNIK